MKRIVNKLDVVWIDAIGTMSGFPLPIDIPQKFYNFVTFCGFLIAYINLAVRKEEEETQTT